MPPPQRTLQPGADEVVVTATRIPTCRESQVASSVTIITAGEIEARQLQGEPLPDVPSKTFRASTSFDPADRAGRHRFSCAAPTPITPRYSSMESM